MHDSSPGRPTPAPPPDDQDRIERALGWRPTSYRPAAADRGPSGTAARWIVGDGGPSGRRRRSAFVKIGATPLTADWTRAEHRNYLALGGPFLPQVLGFDDDGERPVLAIEDLASADWPPPWTDARVSAVLDALAEIRRTPPPAHLRPWNHEPEADWAVLAADPDPFLALGICSRDWLAAALPALADAAATASFDGGTLLHMDIRSDNLCIRDRRAIVIDWNHASIGRADLDVAFWLPSLHAEGGPPPEAILPDAPGLAACVAGFFCAQAGEPPIPEAPHVRPLQVAQSRTALPWAARALGLPPPG